MKHLRLPGHELPLQGALHPQGLDLPRNGPGRTRCTCGAESPHLPSTAARRRWHRDHKEWVAGRGPGPGLREQIVARLDLDGHDGDCVPGWCVHAAAVALRAVVDLHAVGMVTGLGLGQVCFGCKVVGSAPRPDGCRTVAVIAEALGVSDAS